MKGDAGMNAANKRLGIALLTVAVSVTLTMWIATLQTQSTMSLQEMVTRHPAWGVASAALFLMLVTWIMGWRDMGFKRPEPMSSLGLLWLPALYLVVLGTIGVLTGRFHTAAMLMVLLNTAMVGFSEELAFRGVLWGAVRKTLPFWPGFLLVSLAFGSVHILNTLITGEFGAAGVQALNAFMSGVAYLAIRIRTRSIIPIMVIHAAWDFVVFMIGSGAQGAAPEPGLWQQQLLGGLALVGPLFIYGLWLVRNERVRAGWRDDSFNAPFSSAGEKA